MSDRVAWFAYLFALALLGFIGWRLMPADAAAQERVTEYRVQRITAAPGLPIRVDYPQGPFKAHPTLQACVDARTRLLAQAQPPTPPVSVFWGCVVRFSDTA